MTWIKGATLCRSRGLLGLYQRISRENLYKVPMGIYPAVYYQDLGRIVWDNVGMARNRAGLEQAIADIQALRAEY